jgi:hypothetical protein
MEFIESYRVQCGISELYQGQTRGSSRCPFLGGVLKYGNVGDAMIRELSQSLECIGISNES